MQPNDGRPSDGRPSGDRPWDVIVLGGGIVGACAARSLAVGNAAEHRAARSVLLLDAFEAGHTRGSSHGDGRIVRFTYPEQTYLDMAKSAFPAWADIERESGVRLIETTGGFECGPAGSPEILELREGMGAAGIPFERLDADEARRRFPHFAVDDDHEILFQDSGAIVRADLAVGTLWDLVQDAGAQVAAGCRAEQIEVGHDGEGPLITVSGRRQGGEGFRFAARALVVAAGGWSRELLRPLGLDLPLQVSREVVAYFPTRRSTTVDHGVASMPTLIDYDGEDIFYALPQIDVPGVKIGWHHAGPETDPDEIGELDGKVLQGIVAYAERRFPHLDPDPAKVLTCLYTNTPDYHFVIDRHPEIPQIVIGTGFSGHGFKFGPVSGELLADLASGIEPTLDLDLFRIARFSSSNLARRTNA